MEDEATATTFDGVFEVAGGVDGGVCCNCGAQHTTLLGVDVATNGLVEPTNADATDSCEGQGEADGAAVVAVIFGVPNDENTVEERLKLLYLNVR